MGGVILVAWSMAVSFSPVRFVTEEADLKLDMGSIVLQEFGRLQNKIPGIQTFDAGSALDDYRNADAEAVKRAQGASPPKKEQESENKDKNKGVSGDVEDDASITNIRKQLQNDE